MSRIIAVVNQKGGVGKTTTAVTLAHCLSEMGKRVLLVDCDPQGNATSGLDLDPRSLPQSLYHVLVHDADVAAVVQKTTYPNLSVLPSNVDLAGASVELVDVEGREHILEKKLQEVADDYDFVFIDCPPAVGVLTINGMVGAEEILIPVQTEYYALEGLSQLLRTIELVQEHLKPRLEVLGAVLTMYDARNRLSESVVEDMHQHFPYHVFKSIIPRNVRVAEAPSHGKAVTDYAPKSRGAESYRKLAEEIALRTVNPVGAIHPPLPPLIPLNEVHEETNQQ